MLALMAILEMTKKGSHNHQNCNRSIRNPELGGRLVEVYFETDWQLFRRLNIPGMLPSAMMRSRYGAGREDNESHLQGCISR